MLLVLFILIINKNETEIVVRSVYSKDGKLLIGTQSSQIFELPLNDLSKIDCICNAHGEGN